MRIYVYPDGEWHSEDDTTIEAMVASYGEDYKAVDVPGPILDRVTHARPGTDDQYAIDNFALAVANVYKRRQICGLNGL